MPLQISISERAAKRIATIIQSEPPGSMLRIAVDGGGCSGFQYKFSFDTERGENDIVIDKDGATILVDEMSLQYMDGSVLDYVDDMIGSSFRIENPLAVASCGCGTSFSV